jgi:hypothetical protein
VAAVSRSVRRRLAGVLLGLSLGLLGVELILRSFGELMPNEARLRLNWQRIIAGDLLRSVPDAELGYRFAPSARGEYALSDLSFAYATDEHGFRNPSPWPAAAEIVVVGDSTAFGFGVSDRDQWVQLVRDGLARARIVNLALPGYAPLQAARAFEQYGRGLAPRLLIAGLFPANDVKDERDFARWLALGAQGNYDLWHLLDSGPASWMRSSYLAQFLVGHGWGLDRGLRSRTLDLAQGPLRLVPSQIRSSSRGARRGHPDFEAVVRTLTELERAAGEIRARVLFLVFPCKEEVYLPGVGARGPTRPFVELLRERGWELIDLQPLFAERAARGERLYFEVDGHPDELGNRLIAAAVLAWIAAEMPELR